MAELSPAASQALRLPELFKETLDPWAIFAARIAYADALVSNSARNELGRISPPFALAAVGGYGRRELFPHSDIDVLLLFEDEAQVTGSKEPFGSFLRALWDGGLRMSQSVRTVQECCTLNEQNIELHISLLDARFLYGDEALFEKFAERLREFNTRQAAVLTRHLAEMSRQRHAGFHNTPYHLEPNVKEAPGGIRDLQVLHWLAFLAPQKEQYRESQAESAGAREFLFRVRCFLHLEANRDNNLLGFELQDKAAQFLQQPPVTAEDWMRSYYRSARRVFASTRRALDFTEAQHDSLLRQFRDRRQRLSTPDLTVSHDRVFLRNPAAIVSSVESILSVFTFVARHGIPLSWDAERRLRSNTPKVNAAFEESRAPWQVWRELFVQPNAALALHEMQETNVLAAAIPEWQAVDSLVVRDFYHRYTVDEHSLVAIEGIDRLAANDGETPARMRELAQSDDDLAIIRLALLLHDIGKGTSPGDHVTGSKETAAQVLARLGVPEAERNAVILLIDRHLVLSQVMNGRDLGDPATARFLTSRVGTQEDLRRLTLLTYADISAVNPSAMTPWRLEQLRRVYGIASEQLTRELGERIRSTHEAPAVSFAGAELSRFLEGFPQRYLRAYGREEIERHFALEKIRARDGVAVEIKKEPGVFVTTVLSTDQPGLFSALCGALASFGMNIVEAEAYANSSQCALEVIRFSDPMRTLELNPEETGRLEWTLACVVRGAIQVSDLLKRRRPAKRLPARARIAPAVRFNNDASDTSTLLEFVGEDRPGLLHDLTSALAEAKCDIELVLADTEGQKVIDVFYITKDKTKLEAAEEASLELALIAAGRQD